MSLPMVPKFETDEQGPFDTPEFRSLNFVKWVTLPMPLGFYSCLAFGLLMHTYPKYVKHMSDKLNLCITQIQQVDTNWFNYGDQRFLYSLYWEELGRACKEFLSYQFQHSDPAKPELSKRVKADIVIDFADRDTYNRIASFLEAEIHVFDYMNTGDEKIYCNQGRAVVIVCLVVCNPEVSVLIHRDFKFTGEVGEGFPHYRMKSCAEKVFSPIAPNHQQHQSLQDPSLQVQVEALSEIVNRLSDIIRSSLQQLDPALVDYIEKVRKILNELMQRHSQDPSFCPNLEWDSIQQAINLPTAVPQVPQFPHTYANCSQFPQAGMLIYHGHAVHKQCLGQYLTECLEERKTEFRCTRAGCAQVLPQDILNEFPDIRERFFAAKSKTIATSDESSPCSRHPSTKSTVTLPHGCKLCHQCVSLSFDRESCAHCRRDLDQFDYQVLHKPSQSLG